MLPILGDFSQAGAKLQNATCVQKVTVLTKGIKGYELHTGLFYK